MSDTIKLKLTSESFKAEKTLSGKQFRSGTMGRALTDAYQDIDRAFERTENSGCIAFGILHMDAAGSDGDTIVIGGDTYELNTATAISDDLFIGVKIGADATATMVNLAAAINGAGTAVADGVLKVGGAAPVLLVNGTESVVAEASGANEMLLAPADKPGGTAKKGPAAIALSETGLAVGDGWNAPTLADSGSTSVGKMAVFGPRLTTTLSIANGGDLQIIDLDFVPGTYTAMARVTSTKKEIVTTNLVVDVTDNGDGTSRVVVDARSDTVTANDQELTVVFYE